MKILTVFFQAIYAQDVEVPDDWEPTPENIEQVTDTARNCADFSDGGASWDACSIADGDLSYEAI